MSLMNVVRIAKLLALLAFVLPWAAVSCNNVDVATASGIELIQGTMSKNPDAGKQFSRQMGSAFGGDPGEADLGAGGMDGPTPDLGVNVFGIAAVAIIVLGLALSFAGKGRGVARNVMITSLLGLALCFGTVWWWKEQVKGQSSEGEGRGGRAESPFGGGGDARIGEMGSMGAMGAQMMDEMLQERFGYWIALSALAVAAGAGALGMAGGAGAARPQAEPPAA